MDVDPAGVSDAPLVLSADHAGPLGKMVVGGEVDGRAAAHLRAASRALVACGASELVLDLRGVDFLDSTGLNALIDMSSMVDAAGGSVAIEGASDLVRKVLSVTALDTVLDVRDR